MWSPAVTAVRTRGIACFYVPLKEGYRAWAQRLGLMAHLDGIKLDAAYEYLNWYLSGWQGGFIAKQGYYTLGAGDRQGSYDARTSGTTGTRASRPQSDIKDPYGNLMEKAGHVRDGGAFWERMGNIACWNTVMDENRLHGPQVERVHLGLTRRTEAGRLRIAAAGPAILRRRQLACRRSDDACRRAVRRPTCRWRRWRWCCWSSSASRWSIDRRRQLLELRQFDIYPGLHRSTTTPTCSPPRSRYTLYLQDHLLRRRSTWAITLVIGFTVSYFLVFHVRTLLWQIALFLLCTVPFWTSNVIRMISWIPFLGRNGIFNQSLMAARRHRPAARVPAVLRLRGDPRLCPPVHAVHDRADLQLHGAHRPGADRGGGRRRREPWQVIWEVVMPLSKTGIALGSIFVITLVMGDFFVVRIDERRPERLGRARR